MTGSPPGVTVSTPRRISFEVEGRPRQQGSMRSPAAGVVLHDSVNLKGWRQAVAVRCREVFKGLPHAGPVQLSLYFTFSTPRLHRGKTQKTTAPDLDKLIRAVCDGLTGVLYVDDAQVFHVEAEKAWSAEVPQGVGVEAWLQPLQKGK